MKVLSFIFSPQSIVHCLYPRRLGCFKGHFITHHPLQCVKVLKSSLEHLHTIVWLLLLGKNVGNRRSGTQY